MRSRGLELTRWTMSDDHKECQDCGWRGKTAELDLTDDGSGSRTHIFCPDCGGVDIKDLDSDEEAASESQSEGTIENAGN